MKMAMKSAPWIVGLLLILFVEEVLNLRGSAAWFFYALSIGAGIAVHFFSPWLWLHLAPMHSDFAHFSSIAEDEVDDSEVDSGLWSEALIKSHGDESRRKIMYMRLRAAQLLKEQDD